MDEFDPQRAFVEHLTSLKGDKPLNCDYLRVLPEQVTVDMSLLGRRVYNKGDLLCIRSVEVPQSALGEYRCGLGGILRLNKEGDLEVGCQWGPFLGKKLKIKIIE